MTAYFIVGRNTSASMLGDLPAYRGIDRSPWECVDDVYYSERLSPELDATRRASFRHFVGNLSFGTVSSEREARDLVAACAVVKSSQSILAVRAIGILDELVGEDVRGCSLGLDAYVDGYGSVIALGLSRIVESFPETRSRLTNAGLFESLEDLRVYWRRYLQMTKVLDLEPLSGVGPVWVYDVIEEISL